MLGACFLGDLELVDGLIIKYSLKDIAHLKGYKEPLTISSDEDNFCKEYKSLRDWNPLLLAIGNKQAEVTQYLFEHLESFHKLNCLSRPYADEEQKDKVFD